VPYRRGLFFLEGEKEMRRCVPGGPGGMHAKTLAPIGLVAIMVIAASAIPRAQTGVPAHPMNLAKRTYAGQALSLQDALQAAVEHNPDLLALRAMTDVVRHRPAEAQALAPPTLQSQIWQWPFNSVNPASANMYMFTVSQDLPGRGKRALRASIGEKDIALAESEVASRAQALRNEVVHAYAALFVARAGIDLHIENVALLRQIADASQVKYESGRGSQQDVLKPVLEISKVHGDIIRHEADAGLAAAMLNTLLGRPADSDIGPLVTPEGPAALPSVADLQRLVLDHHPDVRRVQLEIEKARAALASVTADRKPDFTVSGGYMLMPRMTDAWTASVGINWPNAPWARSGATARIAEAAAAVSAAVARRAAIENELRGALQQAYVRVAAAERQAALLETTLLPQARQALDASRIAYQGDRVEFQAVLDSERTLVEMELARVQAQVDLLLAWSDLERATGTSLRGPSTPLDRAVVR
jgi:outer membrane protein, heavy metal efflux system